MSERGVFAVDRGVWDHPSFPPELFSEREAWLWLCGQAAWKPTRVYIRRNPIDLERGQCAFAMRFLAAKWQWSEPRVRRFFDRRTSDAMVLVRATRVATLITICNYEKYAFGRRTDVPSIDAQAFEETTDQRRKEEEPKNLRTKKDKKDTPADAGSTGYVFESGIIRLNQRDFDRWKANFTHIDLGAELLSLTKWAEEQGKDRWFHAVAGGLAKRNRDVKAAASRAAEGDQFDWRKAII